MLGKQWRLSTREGLILVLCSFNSLTWFTFGLVMTMRVALRKGLSSYMQAYGVMLVAVVFWAITRFFSSSVLVAMLIQVMLSSLVFIVGLTLVFIHRCSRIYTLTLLTLMLWAIFWFSMAPDLGNIIISEEMWVFLPLIGGQEGAENIEYNVEQLRLTLLQSGPMLIFLWLSFGWLVAKYRASHDYLAEVKGFKVPKGVQILTFVLCVFWLMPLGLVHFGYQVNFGWLYFVAINATGIVLRLYGLAGAGLLLKTVERKEMSHKGQKTLLRILVITHFIPVINVLSLFFLAGYAVLPSRHHNA